MYLCIYKMHDAVCVLILWSSCNLHVETVSKLLRLSLQVYHGVVVRFSES